MVDEVDALLADACAEDGLCYRTIARQYLTRC